jgi:transposase
MMGSGSGVKRRSPTFMFCVPSRILNLNNRPQLTIRNLLYLRTKLLAFARQSKRAGATLRYLPQYSPDLNPIEMPFSKLKASLSKAAERVIPRLRRRIGRFACTLSAREARNYFRHARYE